MGAFPERGRPLKRIALITALIALIVAGLSTTAGAVPMSQKSIKRGNVVFPNLVECLLTLEEPHWAYYEPWNLAYVDDKAYARCTIKSGSILLPYNMAAIGLHILLYRQDLMDATGRQRRPVLVGEGRSNVTFTSLTSVEAAHICAGGTSDYYTSYYGEAEAFFLLGDGQEAYVTASTTQIPMFCA
jgi:hypothetical protein